MLDQKIIPAISNYKNIDKFLESKLEYGILMNFHLAQLADIVAKLKQHDKKVLVHSELIKGLSSDEDGAIYLLQNLKVDGIISSKPKVIEICKKRHVIGVYRFFIKDTISLEQSLKIGIKLKPQCVEILPSYCYDLVEEIKNNLHCEIWLGGLLKEKAQIDSCFTAGAASVTISDYRLWNYK